MNWKALAKSLGIVVGIPAVVILGSVVPGIVLRFIWIAAITLLAVGITWALYDVFDK